MSSLWTPGGEVPIDRGGASTSQETDRADEARPAETGPAETGDQAAVREEVDRMRRQLLDAPAADVVAQHAAALYELAALHLSEPEPRLADVRLAIDALAALLDGLHGRLGQAEGPLAEALPQLKMAYVEATDRGT